MLQTLKYYNIKMLQFYLCCDYYIFQKYSVKIYFYQKFYFEFSFKYSQTASHW